MKKSDHVVTLGLSARDNLADLRRAIPPDQACALQSSCQGLYPCSPTYYSGPGPLLQHIGTAERCGQEDTVRGQALEAACLAGAKPWLS